MSSFFRRLRARIKYWNHAEQLAKELEVHRAIAAEDLARNGDSPHDARWKAARLLGNDTIAREDARAVWVARWVEQGLQDIRYALRTMRREWGFAITATITFALGLGVLIGVFSVFNAVHLRQWPVRDAGAVFGTSQVPLAPSPGAPAFSGRRISYSVWAAVQPEMTTADLAARRDVNVTMRPNENGPGQSGRIALVNDGFIETVGIGLQMGSMPADRGRPAIVITDAVWQTAYGRDPNVIGKPMWLGDKQAVVTGVLEPRFRGFPPELSSGLMRFEQAEGWITRDTDFLTNPKNCCVEITGRLRPGHTRAEAAAELQGRVNPRQVALGLDEMRVEAFNTAMASRPNGIRNTVPTLFALLFAGCGIVTLLACANIGNLHLARGLRRRREMAVRLSLGAGRGRVVRQLVTEGAVLALCGTVGGLIIAWTVPPAIMTIDNPSSLVVTPDFVVITFAAALAGVVAILSALAPALRVTRIDWRSASSNVIPGAGVLRSILLGAQVALSLGLIASAGLLSHGVIKAAGGADAGFRSDGLESVIIYGTNDGAQAAVIDAISTIPYLAMTDTAPWTGHTETATFHTPGGASETSARLYGMNRRATALLELPLIAGRWPDDDKRLKEAVVSRSAASALWSNVDVLGRTILKKGEEEPYAVVGVMADVRMADASDSPSVIIARRSRTRAEVIVPAGSAAPVIAVASGVDPGIRPVATPLVAGLRRQLKNSIAGASVASGLGFVALLLASLGVFGVFSYLVEERRREIGVRLALGATARHVRRSIAVSTRAPVIGGLAIGLALAIVGGFVLRSSLFGLSILDPLSYLSAAAILGAAALIATLVPLRRALRVDPAITLRQE
jgi:predicted permease